MKNNPLLMTDGYKVSHHLMYHPETTMVYSNYTCRSTARMPENAKKVVVFGIEYAITYLHELWRDNFFSREKINVCQEAKAFFSSYLGCDYDVSHFEELHDLGYLPICVRALDEGTVIDERIALLTIHNTLPQFFWVTNFLETMLSTLLWKPIHSASLAFAYKKVLTKYALETDKDNLWFVDFQGHDFSFRGMQSPEAAIASGMGFATSFKGSDTIPVMQAAKYYYNNSRDVIFSVNASEHSVACSYSKENEIEYFKHLMETFPKGVLSVVSDTWDLWKVLTEYLPTLKEEILSRDGKLVIRPDSGDPVDIICGELYDRNLSDYPTKEEINLVNDFEKLHYESPQGKGVIELLWDTFGGTINEQGYKVLDSHIGAIYGDSITLERAEQICKRLKAKGFATTGIVLGVGSCSMGYATRDSQGGAVKSTYVELDGRGVEIFKDPVTDDGVKKSAKGLVTVHQNTDGTYYMKDQVSKSESQKGLLTRVYEEGIFYKRPTFEEIRERIQKAL